MKFDMKKARRLLSKGKVPECEQLCQKELGQNPGSIAALDLLADCCAARGDFGRARLLLSRLLEISTDDAKSAAARHGRLAEYCNTLGEKAGAETHMLQAIELVPDQPAHYARLMSFYFLEGRVTDAGALVKPLLDVLLAGRGEVSQRDHALIAQGAYLVSQVAKNDSVLSALEQMLQVEIASGLAWLSGSADFQFGVAALFDKAEDYKAAWPRFLKANASRRRISGFKLQPVLQQIRQITGAFTGEFFATDVLAGQQPGDPRMIFIVGLPRSGTSLVEQIFAAHSAVTAIGESGALSQALAEVMHQRPDCKATQPQSMNAAFFAAVRRSYFGKAGLPKGVEVATDKMPSNLMYAWLIRKAFPDARIILCRRQKLATVMSCFTTNFSNLNNFSEDLSDCAAYYDASMEAGEHWLLSIGESMRAQDYEELVANPREQITGLLAHAGIDPEAGCYEPHKVSRVVQTASILQVTQPIYSSGNERWRRYMPFIENSEELFGGDL